MFVCNNWVTSETGRAVRIQPISQPKTSRPLSKPQHRDVRYVSALHCRHNTSGTPCDGWYSTGHKNLSLLVWKWEMRDRVIKSGGKFYFISEVMLAAVKTFPDVCSKPVNLASGTHSIWLWCGLNFTDGQRRDPILATRVCYIHRTTTMLYEWGSGELGNGRKIQSAWQTSVDHASILTRAKTKS